MICRSFVEKSSAFLFAREEKVNNRPRKEFKKNVRFSFQKKKRNRISFAFKEEQNDTKASCLLVLLLIKLLG